MYRKILLLITILLLIYPLSGCSRLFAPTYSKDKIPEAIKQICKKDYGINEKIDVKISGKTLGARIHLENLVDINLKLQEKSLDKLQDVLRTIRRICLSTDASLDFYEIIGMEEKLGLEVVFYSYIDDLKRAVAGWMSPDDYFQRLIKGMRLDTLRWGNTRINKFVKDIESGNIIKIIGGSFAKGIKITSLDPEFLKIMTDLSKKSYISWNVIKSFSVPAGSQERLFYIEVKERYTPITEEIEKLQYPSGTCHKFYILIEIEELNPVIKSIYTDKTLPEKYKNLGAPDKWDENDFFLEDFTFHEFLSEQIVQLVRSEISKDKDDEEIPFTLKGDFIIKDKIDTQVKLTDPSRNIFKMIIVAKKGKAKEIPQKIIDLALKGIKDVCSKYKFYDLGVIRVEDNKGNLLFTIDKSTLFSKKW